MDEGHIYSYDTTDMVLGILNLTAGNVYKNIIINIMIIFG